MTDNEIMITLRRCADKACYCCTEYGKSYCRETIASLAWDLMHRQKAEIERLQDYNENLRCINTDLSNNLLDEVKTARAEAVKEFAEIIVADYPEMEYYLNDLVKEFTGEEEND